MPVSPLERKDKLLQALAQNPGKYIQSLTGESRTAIAQAIVSDDALSFAFSAEFLETGDSRLLKGAGMEANWLAFKTIGAQEDFPATAKSTRSAYNAKFGTMGDALCDTMFAVAREIAKNLTATQSERRGQRR